MHGLNSVDHLLLLLHILLTFKKVMSGVLSMLSTFSLRTVHKPSMLGSVISQPRETRSKTVEFGVCQDGRWICVLGLISGRCWALYVQGSLCPMRVATYPADV